MKDEDLMTNVQKGEHWAFEELYDRHSKNLHYFFYRMLGGSTEKAEDFLQDLFMKVIEKPDQFDPSRKFTTWIYSIAHNMCKNEYRRMEVRKGMTSEDKAAGIENGEKPIDVMADMNIFRQQLFEKLDKLDDEHKTPFLLRHYEGFSIKEISQVMNCAEGTVKSRIFYTVKKLSRELKHFHTKETVKEKKSTL